MIMNFIYQNELRDSQIPVCRGVLILPYKNGYLSTVCCDIAIYKKDYALTDLDKNFITVLCRVKRNLFGDNQ